MKHTIDNILGACGLIKETVKKGIRLTAYKAYEPPDGVKISYEVNKGGPFIVHVEIDREALGVKKKLPINGAEIMKLINLKIINAKLDNSLMLKRSYVFASGDRKGEEFYDLVSIDKYPGIITTFFHLLGYDTEHLSAWGLLKVIRAVNKSKGIYLCGVYREAGNYKNFTPHYITSKPKKENKK